MFLLQLSSKHFLRAFLAGDIHHYAHHGREKESAESPVKLHTREATDYIVSGSGGAFLHSAALAPNFFLAWSLGNSNMDNPHPVGPRLDLKATYPSRSGSFFAAIWRALSLLKTFWFHAWVLLFAILVPCFVKMYHLTFSCCDKSIEYLIGDSIRPLPFWASFALGYIYLVILLGTVIFIFSESGYGEASSFLGSDEYKGFLRMVVASNDTLHIIAVGIDKPFPEISRNSFRVKGDPSSPHLLYAEHVDRHLFSQAVKVVDYFSLEPDR